eukprot:UN21211
MCEKRLTQETTRQFLEIFRSRTKMATEQMRALRFCQDRLGSLFRTLKLNDMDQFRPISEVCNFASLVSTYVEGFTIT